MLLNVAPVSRQKSWLISFQNTPMKNWMNSFQGLRIFCKTSLQTKLHNDLRKRLARKITILPTAWQSFLPDEKFLSLMSNSILNKCVIQNSNLLPFINTCLVLNFAFACCQLFVQDTETKVWHKYIYVLSSIRKQKTLCLPTPNNNPWRWGFRQSAGVQ